jgi:hypothetical protein
MGVPWPDMVRVSFLLCPKLLAQQIALVHAVFCPIAALRHDHRHGGAKSTEVCAAIAATVRTLDPFMRRKRSVCPKPDRT